MSSVFEPYKSTVKYFSKNNLIIRPSKDEDFKELVNMMFIIYKELSPRLFRWYKNNPSAFGLEFYGLEGQNSRRRIFYSIENSRKELVGSGGIIQHDPKKKPNVGELSDIYLLKEHRGKGLGKILVQDLIKKARKINFESVYLTTRSEFDIALKLYKSLGFSRARKQKYRSKDSISLELKL